MAKYITYENLETFLAEIRRGNMIAGVGDDYKEDEKIGVGHGTIRLGYQYPRDGYLEEIKSYSEILKNITEIPTPPGPKPDESASQEEKDQYAAKKLEYDEYMRIKDSLKSSYSDVRLEDGRAYVKIEDVVYNTDIPDDVETLNKLGDIPEKTKVKDLKGKTYTQLFNDILFPTDNNIKATGVGVSGFNISIPSGERTVKLGTPVATISNGGELLRGYWDKYNGNAEDGGIRVIGEETDRNYFIEGLGINSTAGDLTVNDPVIEDKYEKCGDCVYKVIIDHNAGTDNPKNNKGDYIDLSLPEHQSIANAMKAGSKTVSITVNVTAPCYIKNKTGGFDEKLIKWSESPMYLEYNFPQHTTKNKLEFQIPRKMSTMQLFDVASNTWKDAEDIPLWGVTQEIKIFNEVEYKYYNYIYNFNGDKDPVKIKISF